MDVTVYVSSTNTAGVLVLTPVNIWSVVIDSQSPGWTPVVT